MTLEDLAELAAAGDDRFDFALPPGHKQQQDPQYDMQQYNPFISRPNMTWDDRTMDRMLTIKRPYAESGEIWITEAGFAETLSLLPLNKIEQNKFWKKFRKIQMLASGECNKKIVDSKQERLMMELVSQKSRLDVSINGNLNERQSWITNRQLVEQTLKTPPPSQPKGFFGSIVSSLSGK